MRGTEQACLCVLAGFGLVSVVMSTLTHLTTSRSGKRPAISLVIIFRDKEDIAECLLRAVINLRMLGDSPDYDVVAVDDGSSDHTPAILDRLARRFGLLRVVKLQASAHDPRTAVDVGLTQARGRVSIVCDARQALPVVDTADAIFSLLRPGCRGASHQGMRAGNNQVHARRTG